MVTLRSNNSGFSLHTVLIVLAAIAGVVAIGLFTKNQAEISQERQHFLAAQKEVNELGAKLAKATNPDKHEAVAYCDYGHVKFGKGGRTCWVKYYLLYEETTFSKAIDTFFSNKKLIPRAYVFDNTELEGFDNSRSLKFSTTSFFKPCSYTFYFRESDTTLAGAPSFDQPKDSALIEINCSGEAKAEHFPVKE